MSKLKKYYKQAFLIILFITIIFLATYNYLQILTIKKTLVANPNNYSSTNTEDVMDYLLERERLLEFLINGEGYSTGLVVTLKGRFNEFYNEELLKIQNDYFKKVYIPRKSVIREHKGYIEKTKDINTKLYEEQNSQIPLLCVQTSLYLDWGYDHSIKARFSFTEDLKPTVICVKGEGIDSKLEYLLIGSDKNGRLKIQYEWNNKEIEKIYSQRTVATNSLEPVMLTKGGNFYFGERTAGGGWSASSLFSLNLGSGDLTELFYCSGGIEGDLSGTYGENCVFWDNSLTLQYNEMRKPFYKVLNDMGYKEEDIKNL